MIKKVISLANRTRIELERLLDHAERVITGKPTARRSQITPSVFIGGQYRLNALLLFQRLGITGIVNMRSRALYSDTDLAPIRMLHLPTKDLHAPSLESLKKGILFIHDQIKQGGKVYIHCHFGEGRGPSMAIAYLMSQGMLLEDTLALVRRHRPFIRITPPQLERLKEFESELFSKLPRE